MGQEREIERDSLRVPGTTLTPAWCLRRAGSTNLAGHRIALGIVRDPGPFRDVIGRPPSRTPVLAIAATVGHYIITVGFPPLARLVSRPRGHEYALHLDYLDGGGDLNALAAELTELPGIRRASTNGEDGSRGEHPT